MDVSMKHISRGKSCESEEVSTVAGSISSSERSELGIGIESICWDEVHFGTRIQPYRGYAHCADDVFLLGTFLELTRLPDIYGDSLKLLLRAIRLLHLCDYSIEDICSILAHASAYFYDAYKLCGSHMDGNEVGNVLGTLMFIAHSYVQDETCPLHIWHQHLFRKYCPLRTLNAAVVRLLEIRRFKLRLEPKDLSDRYNKLSRSVQWRYGGYVTGLPPEDTVQKNMMNKMLDYYKR